MRVLAMVRLKVLETKLIAMKVAARLGKAFVQVGSDQQHRKCTIFSLWL
jgi:hypothetical protein